MNESDRPQNILAPQRLDAAHADALEAQFEEAIRAGRYNLALSFENTVFVSSAGIRSLMRGYQKLHKLGGSLRAVAAREAVRDVLALSGLLALLETPAPDSPVRPPAAPKIVETDSVRLELEPLPEPANNTLQILGRADALAECDRAGIALIGLRIAPDLCGVGLGALGAPDASTADRVGEWATLCGVTFALPPDSHVPDYTISSNDYQPESQVLYAACFPGRFSHAARFRARSAGQAVTLSHLLDTALSWSGCSRIGVLLAAESAGLIGATMTASPLKASGGFFDYPAIRERLALTPEPEHNGALALVTGVVCRRETPADRQAFVRPMNADPRLFAHLHAVVCSFSALPAGRVAPDALVRQLAEHNKLLTILHVLRTQNAAADADESTFRGGLLWTTPLLDSQPEATR